MDTKLRVVERGNDMVLAEHFTAVGSRLKATTLEVVGFERPSRIRFRLVRGPVPQVTETFDLDSNEGGTAFTYCGELGTDFWAPGHWWGGRVAKAWTRVVEASLREISAEAERRAHTGTPVQAEHG